MAWKNLHAELYEVFRSLEGHCTSGGLKALGLRRVGWVGQNKEKKSDWYQSRIKLAKLSGTFEALKEKNRTAQAKYRANGGMRAWLDSKGWSGSLRQYYKWKALHGPKATRSP